MKQFGGIRRLALDPKQDVESSRAGWRNHRMRVPSSWFHVASMTEAAADEKKFVGQGIMSPASRQEAGDSREESQRWKCASFLPVVVLEVRVRCRGRSRQKDDRRPPSAPQVTARSPARTPAIVACCCRETS